MKCQGCPYDVAERNNVTDSAVRMRDYPRGFEKDSLDFAWHSIEILKIGNATDE